MYNMYVCLYVCIGVLIVHPFIYVAIHGCSSSIGGNPHTQSVVEDKGR